MRPLVWWILGLTVRDRHYLPRDGPAIIVANHNSHLDTLVIMSLFPLSQLLQIRPLADEAYFLHQNRCLAWIARHIFEIIPVTREVREADARQKLCIQRTFLNTCSTALSQKNILILYPEGSRGEPEILSNFKSGIAHLAKHHPHVPIVPIYLKGLGKVLPKGDLLLVPFFCQVTIGEPLYWSGAKHAFLAQLRDRFSTLTAS
ncbi:lysophospholipid acyltransferase family protein [Trichothermofontia sp.]